MTVVSPETGKVIMDGVLGLAAAGGWIWLAWERFQKSRLAKAYTDANVAVADGQEKLYNLMTDRLGSLEKDVEDFRGELKEERAHSRQLDLALQRYQIHVLRLEAMMREANLEPPQLELHNV